METLLRYFPDLTAAQRERFAVLDEAYFPEVMSARNVGKVMALTYKNWDAAAFEGYLKKFSLAPDKIFKDYSRGMRM